MSSSVAFGRVGCFLGSIENVGVGGSGGGVLLHE